MGGRWSFEESRYGCGSECRIQALGQLPSGLNVMEQ